MNKRNHVLQKQFLFCPGPVNIAANIKDAVIYNEIGHREKEFSTLLKGIHRKLLKVFEVKNTRKYFSVVITGSGTAANESILSSIVGNKKILVLSNGEFGERLYAISQLHNPNTYTIKFNWGTPIDLEEVEHYLKTHDIDIVSMVHHETSTGMLNPIARIGTLTKKYKNMFIVDAISSAGAEKIDLENWNISFCSSSASKAVGSLPGIAFIIGKKTEFERLKDVPAKTVYLNLYKFYSYSKDHSQTPNTPAVQLFYAFEKALDNILTDGVEVRRRTIRELSSILRLGMKNLGFKFLLDENDMSSVLTTVRVPKHITIEELKERLKDKNIIIYNGKGPLVDKVFQVGSIGDLNKEKILFFLQSIKEGLDSFEQDIIVQKKVKIQSDLSRKISIKTPLPRVSSVSHTLKA